MALSYRQKRRWSLFILLVGMPVYAVLVVLGMAWLGPFPVWAELPLYVFFGLLWAFPFKNVFMGVGQADPDAPQNENDPLE